jgi:hypothetical protein
MLIMFAAAAALAGCSKENHTIVADPTGDSDTNATANAPVALPPTVASSKVYRCADNKVVYVDWLSDDKTANIRTEKAGSPTQVTAPEPGKPLAGPAGYSIDGTPSAKSIKIAVPGHASQNCNA